MDDKAYIRETTPEKPIKSNEISISQWAKDKLKKMSIRRRIKWRSLIAKGYTEKDAFLLLNSNFKINKLPEPKEYKL